VAVQPAAPVAVAPKQESLVQSSLEEDQLEIPTFLRRQAN
jgi:cell division protein FtsZ